MKDITSFVKFDRKIKPWARFEVVEMTKVHRKFHGLPCRQQSVESQVGDGRRGPGLGL